MITEKIREYTSRIMCDKRLHFMIGVITASILGLVLSNIYLIIALLTVVAWGIEVQQLLSKTGAYENWDALYVMLGGLFVLLPYLGVLNGKY